MISKRVFLIAVALLVATATGAMAAEVHTQYFDVNTLTIGPADWLDMQTAGLVHSGATGGTPFATINGYLTTGYQDGGLFDWKGVGIQRQAFSSDGLAIGAIVNDVGGGTPRYTTWAGATVTATDTIFRSTYSGDSNLDGVVNGADVTALLAGYGVTSGGTWATGDFNYDGKVNGADVTALLSKYGNPALGMPPAVLPAAAASSPTVVPEPGTFVLLFLGAVGALFLRRKFN